MSTVIISRTVKMHISKHRHCITAHCIPFTILIAKTIFLHSINYISNKTTRGNLMEFNDFSNLQYSQTPDAIAVVKGNDNHPDLYGVVLFFQTALGVLINAQFEGLPVMSGTDVSRFLGFHIHENGDCSQNEESDFNLTGSHYNPDDQIHPDHRGDLPSILNCNGYAWQSFLTNVFMVTDVVGRSVVVHAMPDDFMTQPSGNSGEKIACGVIELIN